MTPPTRLAALALTSGLILGACGGGGGNGDTPNPPAPPPQPQSVKHEKIGGYATGQFGG